MVETVRPARAEIIKLRANSYDHASTACYAGAVATVGDDPFAWGPLLAVVAWVMVGWSLHLAAKRVLGELDDDA